MNTYHACTGGWRERLKKARKQAGLSQEALGKKVGVAQNTIASWEAPAGNEPTLEKFEQIATATGTLASWLIFGDAPTAEPSADASAAPEAAE